MAQHYTRPPIVEALIDFRVEPPPGASAVDVAIAMSELQQSFRRDDIHAGNVSLTISPSAPPVVNVGNTLIGFRYTNADSTVVVQAQTGGFTFSLLCDPNSGDKRYRDWLSLRNEAKQMWEIYSRGYPLQSVTSTGVRYINRFDLPREAGGLVRLEEYFDVYPHEPKLLEAHDHVAFNLHLAMPQPDIQALLILNQGSSQFIGDDKMSSILLDLELRSNGSQPWASDDARIWEYLERLRKRKNEAFESFITDKTRLLLQ